MTNARLRVLFLAITDMTVFFIVWIGTASIYRFFGGNYELSTYWSCWPMLAVLVVCNVFIRLYHGNILTPGMPLPQAREIERLFLSNSVTYLLMFAYMSLLRRNEDYSRFVLLFSWFAGCVALPMGRALVRFLLKKCNVAQIPVLIAGGGVTGRQVRRIIDENAFWGLRFAGFLDDNPEVCDRVGSLTSAAAIGRKLNIQHLVMCLPLEKVKRYLQFRNHGFPLTLVILDNAMLPGAWMYPCDLHGMTGMEICDKLMQPSQLALKRLSEIAISAIGIVALSPAFLLLALAVKLSGPGPVFYRARRIGKRGRPIVVWKFRTMRSDADVELDRLLNSNPELMREWKANFKLVNDPRVIRIGRLLRKSSLDELPQLFNVLRGEMSLVGPRPIVEKEVSYYGSYYEIFSMVRPGITGLWQVSGRSDTDYVQRVRLDVCYVLNWSIWLDIYILVRTVGEVIRGRGAM